MKTLGNVWADLKSGQMLPKQMNFSQNLSNWATFREVLLHKNLRNILIHRN